MLICIDTLRADRLGALGSGAGLTPNIDHLASKGVLFRRAYAQAANTPQSFPSIFTSLYPSRVPTSQPRSGYPPIAEEATTLFEVLRDHGFATIAVTSHFYFEAKRGILQGFAEAENRGATTLRDSNADVASPRVVAQATARLERLARGKTRFAMFVHLFEPHSTYVRHPDFHYTKSGTAGLRERYDLEVRFVDRWVGTLLDALAALKLDQNTTVVLFSDHGESFGEHRFYFHGQALYNEVLHVPLIVSVPGRTARQVDPPVALLDIAPTVLDLVGAPVPEAFQGRSLLPDMEGHSGAPRDSPIGAVLLPYPAWPHAQQAVILGRYKVLMRIEENQLEAYDLERDPGEQRNLAISEPALAQTLRAAYARFAEREL